MMKPAILIYNVGAGNSQTASPEVLLAGLRHSGYDIKYSPTNDEHDLRAALQNVSGTVFVAGGDGTVRGVALRLLQQPGVQLAILPMGTSNNIARTLNLSNDPGELVQQYADAQAIAYDVGQIEAPWGKDFFIEACGCGIFADVLAAYDPEAKKSPLRAVQAVLSTMPNYEGLALELKLDGLASPAAKLTLLEVMNIRATGNSMKLATSADPGDGQLDVVTVDAEHRDGLVAYLSALARDEFEQLSSVTTSLASAVEIPYIGQAFHIDGEVRPAAELGEQKAAETVNIRILPGALQMLVPSVSLKH